MPRDEPTMSEGDFDEQVALVMVGLMRVRRALDPGSLDSLLGSILAEIQLGLDLAEEQALERIIRRSAEGNVVQFRSNHAPSPDTDHDAF